MNGTDAMLCELQRGPITCSIAITEEFQNYGGVFFDGNASFAVFEDETGAVSLEHSISVVGYGVTSQVDGNIPYWIGRNSWGEYWGYHGWFRIVRGKNNLGIESNCQWAVPKNETIWIDKRGNTLDSDTSHVERLNNN